MGVVNDEAKNTTKSGQLTAVNGLTFAVNSMLMGQRIVNWLIIVNRTRVYVNDVNTC